MIETKNKKRLIFLFFSTYLHFLGPQINGENKVGLLEIEDKNNYKNILENEEKINKLSFLKKNSVQTNFAASRTLHLLGTFVINGTMIKNIENDFYTMFLLASHQILESFLFHSWKVPKFFIKESGENLEINYLGVGLTSFISALAPTFIANLMTMLLEVNVEGKDYDKDKISAFKEAFMHIKNQKAFYLANSGLNLGTNFLFGKIQKEHPQNKFYKNFENLSSGEFLAKLNKNQEKIEDNYTCLSYRFMTTASGTNGGALFSLQSKNDGQTYLISSGIDESDYYFTHGCFSSENPSLGLKFQERILTFEFGKKVLGLSLGVFVASNLAPILNNWYKEKFGNYTLIFQNFLEENLLGICKTEFKYIEIDTGLKTKIEKKEKLNQSEIDTLKTKRFNISRMKKTNYIDLKAEDPQVKVLTNYIDTLNSCLEELFKIDKNTTNKNKAEILGNITLKLSKIKHNMFCGGPGTGKTFTSKAQVRLFEEFYKLIKLTLIDQNLIEARSLPQVIVVSTTEVKDYKSYKMIANSIANTIKDQENQNESHMFELTGDFTRLFRKIKTIFKKKEEKPLNVISLVLIDDMPNLDGEVQENNWLKKITNYLLSKESSSNEEKNIERSEFAARMQRQTLQGQEILKFYVNGEIIPVKVDLFNPEKIILNGTSNYQFSTDSTQVSIDRLGAEKIENYSKVSGLKSIVGLNNDTPNEPIYYLNTLANDLAQNIDIVNAIAYALQEINYKLEKSKKSKKKEEWLLTEDFTKQYIRKAIDAASGHPDISIDSAYMEQFSKDGVALYRSGEYADMIRCFFAICIGNRSAYHIAQINLKLVELKEKMSKENLFENFFILTNNLDGLKVNSISSISTAANTLLLETFVQNLYSMGILEVLKNSYEEAYKNKLQPISVEEEKRRRVARHASFSQKPEELGEIYPFLFNNFQENEGNEEEGEEGNENENESENANP